jgi:zinc protease
MELTKSENIWAKLPTQSVIKTIDFPSIGRIEVEGVPVYYYKDESVDVVNIKWIFYSGALQEKKHGAAEITLDMICKETHKRNPEQLFAAFDLIGCDFDANLSHDYTTFSATMLKENLSNVIEIVSDIINNAKLTPIEFEKSYNQAKADLEFIYSSPSSVAAQVLNRICFLGTRYQYPTIAPTDEFELLTLDDCLDYYNNVFLKTHFKVVIVGNFSENELKDSISKHFKQFSSTIDKPTHNNFKIKENEIAYCDTDIKNQTILRLARKSIDSTNGSYVAMQIANIAFGGYFLSRLNENLREDKGLTYGVGSSIFKNRYTSLHTISSSLAKEKTAEALDAIMYELAKFNNERITDEEFERAINYFKGSNYRMMDSVLSYSLLITNLLINDLPIEYYNLRNEKLNSITKEDVFSVQRKYFKPQNFILVLTGDSVVIKKELMKVNSIYLKDIMAYPVNKYGDIDHIVLNS